MPKESFKYSNGEITVTWKPKLCTHSTHCWKELGSVFDPSKRPWIDMQGSTSERIADQVGNCPSGALSVEWNEGGEGRVGGAE